MPIKAREMSALEVKHLNVTGRHAVGGVSGLLLQITDSGNKSWLLRVMVGNKRRSMGLGGFPDVGLADAREEARRLKKLVRQGFDPVAEKEKAKAKLRAEQNAVTFRDVAEMYVRKQSLEFKPSSRAKQVQRLQNSLEKYAYPILGDLQVALIDKALIRAVLEPIWLTKNHTADRLRRNLENILQLAITLEHKKPPNPASWKYHLKDVLPLPSKVAKTQHMKALPVEQMPEFMAKLQFRQGFSARALELAILTATRSGEIRGARWDEIDLVSKLWTIPAERMKTGKKHIIPLPERAVELLQDLPRLHNCELVFPSPRNGQMSDRSMTAVIQTKMKYEVTQHGFRSTFMDWAREFTNHPEEAIELSLAHVNSDSTRAAYARSQLVERRRLLMNDWARYCYEGHGNNILPLKKIK